MAKISSILFFILFYFIFAFVRFTTFILLMVKIQYWFPRKRGSILYLENFPEENAGFQSRAKEWSEILNKKGIYSKVLTTTKSRAKFERQISYKFKWFLIRTMVVRFFQILYSLRFTKIIVRREVLLYNDYGNLFMEKLLFSLHKKDDVFLDFDDDIAFAKKEGRKITLFGRLLHENNYKFSRTLEMYKHFIVCSQYLKNLVLKQNPTSIVCVLPTCVKIKNIVKKYTETTFIVSLVWIGSNGNQKYLDDIVEDLNEVNRYHKIKLIVISGNKYTNGKARFEIENIRWTLKTQYQDLLRGDIGIMPLRNTLEDKGKCGYKLLQYMSVGLVAVASDITINSEIIKDGENGFLVKDSFAETLLRVIKEREYWNKIGELAKETVERKYIFDVNTEKYIKCVGLQV